MSGRWVGLILGAIFASGIAALPAYATPVTFDITSVAFVPGSGYGIDADEGSATLLDVRFSTASFSPQNFNLDLPTPASSNFLFGTIDLEEPNSHSGIVAAETDNLGVTANFTVTSPLGVVQNVTAVGSATTGSVSDSQVDYTLVWTPATVFFGSGGEFVISLDNMTFSGAGSQNINATISLRAKPQGELNVPEPGTLALIGGGLIGWRMLRRRRARRA